LWAREEGPEVGFRHTRWRDIEKVRIRRGSTGGDTKDGKSPRIEVRLSDGTYFAQQGLRCAPVPLADKLGRWLPVHLIELRRPRSGESQKESTLK
ncbi:MAG: hypothetical protein LUE10_02015, partial [Alistipes sp.]|nr:hypothetical protein [Alistipes sp.]